MNDSYIHRALPILRRLAKDAFLLLVVATIAELALRAAAPSYRNHVFDDKLTGSKPLAINQDGYRGTAVPRSKPSGTFRIIILGDSVAFGTGVAAEDTFAARLAGGMRRDFGLDVDVINAAVPAASIGQIRQRYEQIWRAYDPDLAVLAVTGQMVTLDWVFRDQEPESLKKSYIERVQEHRGRGPIDTARVVVNRFVHSFCLPSFLSINSQRALFWLALANHEFNSQDPRGPLFAYGWQQLDVDAQEIIEAWRLTEQELERLNAVLRKDGVGLIATFVPPRFTLSDSLRDNEKCVPLERLTIDAPARFEEMCRELSIPYADSREALRQTRASSSAQSGFLPLYIPFDYSHLDAEGHQAVAERLEDDIRENGLVH